MISSDEIAARRSVPAAGWTRNQKLMLHGFAFAVAFMLLISRRPDVILNAQFWAEDGKYWYADAYHFGWRCLAMPLDGYLNTLSRLAGLFSLLFPFALAPLVMNLLTLAVEVLPVNLLLSDRFSRIPLRTRLIAGLFYIALPNSYETNGILTNLQWRLALIGCMLLLSGPSDARIWRICDTTVLVATTLAGPLGILLNPIAAGLRWVRKDGGHDRHIAALIPGSLLQATFILLSNSRPSPPNGATFPRLIGIVGGQIFASMALGMKTVLIWYLSGDHHSLFRMELAATILGAGIVAYALVYGPREIRFSLLFAGLVLAVALWNPLVIPGSPLPQWEILQFPGLGNRYYFYPMLAVLACLVWMLRSNSPGKQVAHAAAFAALTLMLFGVYKDWSYPRFKDFHFKEFSAEFQKAPAGTKVVIPLNPTGWSMELVKRD